jgi:hypothetical protein
VAFRFQSSQTMCLDIAGVQHGRRCCSQTVGLPRRPQPELRADVPDSGPATGHLPGALPPVGRSAPVCARRRRAGSFARPSGAQSPPDADPSSRTSGGDQDQDPTAGRDHHDNRCHADHGQGADPHVLPEVIGRAARSAALLGRLARGPRAVHKGRHGVAAQPAGHTKDSTVTAARTKVSRTRAASATAPDGTRTRHWRLSLRLAALRPHPGATARSLPRDRH